MSEVPLINWLNTDVKLSKQITSIPEDFQNGYYFAEILHIFGLIPNFSSYTNSTKKKDISKNYQYLTKAFVDLNIKFNDDKRNQVLNKQKGIAAQLLFQIKQALDRRYISKETLMPKRSRELADIYNANLFKNDNEKYFRDLLNKQAVTGKKKLTPLQKFSQTLSDYDKEILNNIEKDEAYLKKEHDDRLNSIHKKEKEKGQLEKDKDEKNLQSWNNQMTIKRKFDKQMHDEFWSQVEFYKAEVLKAFQNSQQEQVNSVINFNNTLSRLGLDIVDAKLKNKRNDFISTEIIMRRIQEKAKEEEKSRKDKQKRERKIKNEQSKIVKNSIQKSISARLISEEENKIDINAIIEAGKKKREDYEKTKLIHQKYSIKKGEPVVHEEEKIVLPYKSKEDFFDSDYFFTQLNKETLKSLETARNEKESKRNKIKGSIQTMIEMIIDISNEAEKYQMNNKKELIDIPDWNKWMQLFIINQSVSTFQEEDPHAAEDIEVNPNEIEDISEDSIENAKMEFADYITYLGAWALKCPKKPNKLKLYDILGNDIAFMLAGGKVQIGGLKESQLRSMTNEAFEPGKRDFDNLVLPTQNISNPYLGEIIEFLLDLNYDKGTISRSLGKSECQTKRLTVSDEKSSIPQEEKVKEEIKEEEKKETIDKKENETIETPSDEKKENIQFTFKHIPIKICFVGHCFSGRKTQAQLITDMYPNIKSYSIELLIKTALEDYEKVTTPIENMPKFKSMKKNQIEQLKAEKAIIEEQFSYVKSIIEPLATKTIDDLTDDSKIDLLLYQIKKDFPMKTQSEIENELNQRKERLEQIENELSKIKEEQAKKAKTKVKEEQNLTNEKNQLIQDSYSGFIVVDFPKTYAQFKLLEYRCTGFVEEISKEKSEKEIVHDELLFSIDRPFHSNYSKENVKSIFDMFCIFEVSEEESLRRLHNRKLDPHTNIIYHLEDNPPPENDKKLNERLVDITEPSEDIVKSQIKEYYQSFSLIKSFMELFKNTYTIRESNKEEIINEIKDTVINKILSKFEEETSNALNKQQQQQSQAKNNILTENDFEPNKTGNIVVHNTSSNNVMNINNFSGSFISMNCKYQKRVTEVRKKLYNGAFFYTKWKDFVSSYHSTMTLIFIHISKIKQLIITQMSKVQKKFITFLNTPSNKKKSIDIFCKKYTSFRTEFDGKIPYNQIIKNEFNTDLNELTDGLWSIINQRKADAIEERKKIMSCGFIEHQMNYFYTNIENMFLNETEKFLLSVNIIKEFYYNLLPENIRTVQNPFITKIESIRIKEILHDVSPLELFNKTFENNRLVTYPKIEKIYLNCMKVIFKYDYLIRQLESNMKSFTSFNSSTGNLNTSQNINDISSITHGKRRRLHKGQSRAINHSNSNINGNESQFSEDSREVFNIPEEVKTSIESEKSKFKYRIYCIKKYAIDTLNNMLQVSDEIYSLLDEWIIDSVRLQNNMMNKLISHLRNIVDNGKLMLWDFELDKFNIYKEITVHFNSDDFFDPKNRDSDEYDEYLIREINYAQYIDYLSKVYSDVKLYTLQNEFISKDIFEEIFIRKNIIPTLNTNPNIIIKSPLYKLSNHHFRQIINRLIVKNEKGRQDLININHIFTLLALLHFDTVDDTSDILEQVKDNLKDHCFISKEEFYNINFWYEPQEEKINSKLYDENDKYTTVKDFILEMYVNPKDQVNIVEILNVIGLKILGVELTKEVEEIERKNSIISVIEGVDSQNASPKRERKMVKRIKKVFNKYFDLLLK